MFFPTVIVFFPTLNSPEDKNYSKLMEHVTINCGDENVPDSICILEYNYYEVCK